MFKRVEYNSTKAVHADWNTEFVLGQYLDIVFSIIIGIDFDVFYGKVHFNEYT